MRRAALLLATLASGCSTLEPADVRPDPAIPVSWPVGDPYLAQAEVGLPVLTYTQVFQDRRLQTLVGEALTNNRDLMVAAANIAAAREQFRIQRAQQLPSLDANAGATARGTKSDVGADYNAGLSVPSFELDLFGRARDRVERCANEAAAEDHPAAAVSVDDDGPQRDEPVQPGVHLLLRVR